MLEIDSFILAGGASSRMGTDKARLSLDGQQFVERIAGALAPVSRSVSIVGARHPAVEWHLRNVPDVYPQWGALGGLHAALHACKSEWAAVVACDLPFVTGELFVRLASLGENFDAVIPVQTDGRPQPLCALYRRAPCLEAARGLIESGERRPRDLLQKVNTRRVATAELADLSDAQLFFLNINTPEDYKAVISDE
ncbi:MAG: molybdenum cofactor guanylyltransferase [Pyrinomonadaceae bacterium]|nr:molybdenum cofactor guanylyltransferase [Pyrinomonadaceae bacterium]